MLKYSYKPRIFYLFSIVGTWIAWFIAAYLSYTQKFEQWTLELLLLGVAIPAMVSLLLIYTSRNPNLIRDFNDKFSFKNIKVQYLPVIFLLIPATLVLASFIAASFGYLSLKLQFWNAFNNLANLGGFGAFLIFLVPTLEELGWRGYGVDSLKQSSNLFNTSLLFSFLWGIWHIPLFFIYHWNTSILYMFNFFVIFIPLSFIINWIYYKNNRNIVMPIIIHFYIDLIEVGFHPEQVIFSVFNLILIIVSIFIVFKNKRFFFGPLSFCRRCV